MIGRARFAQSLTLGLAIFLLATGASAQVLKVYTQNLKRFGHGSSAYFNSQCDSLVAQAQSADVVLVQEVMDKDRVTNKCLNKLKFWTAVFSTPSQASSYVESYLILYRDTGKYPKATPVKDLKGNTVISGEFCPCVRTPLFVKSTYMATPTSSEKTFWLGDFHATWTGGATARKNEAIKVGELVAKLSKNNMPVIVGGDWNRKGTVGNFPWLQTDNATITPAEERTSLGRSGNQSQAYDHVIASSKVKLGNPKLVGVGSGCPCMTWYKNTSDHLGVMVEATLP